MNDWKIKYDVSLLGIIILINLIGIMYIGFIFMLILLMVYFWVILIVWY